MDNREREITDFFSRYAARFNNSLKGGEVDVDGTAASFAGFFVEASPAGVQGGKNDEKFREAIPQGHAFYKKIGVTSMDIRSQTTTLLDDFHAMTRVQWQCRYSAKNKQGAIDFEVIYLLQTKDREMKIFAYITGDEQKALKEHGLV